MRNLGIVCVLLATLNVGYGQEAQYREKAACRGESCEKGSHLPVDIPTLSKVPHCDRLFRVAPPAALPGTGLPCLPTVTQPELYTQVAGQPMGVCFPGKDADRLDHLLKAADHLTAAGESEQARKVQQQALLEARRLLARLKALETEVAELRRHSSQGQQILVELKLVELSRTKMRAHGFDFVRLHGNDVQAAAYDNRTFGFQVVDDEPPILGMLKALQKEGLARVLAEPTLVTVSGRPASFHVGGEVPALVSQEDGSQKLEYREYGTRVDIVAVALPKEKIRLELRPKISELDPANSVPGTPALSIREVETEVELKSGQTLIISGLVQNRVEARNVGIPWLVDIPYLGELCATIEEHCEETELVLLAKAELVEATYPAEVPQCGPVGPGMQSVLSRDRELYFRGCGEAPDTRITMAARKLAAGFSRRRERRDGQDDPNDQERPTRRRAPRQASDHGARSDPGGDTRPDGEEREGEGSGGSQDGCAAASGAGEGFSCPRQSDEQFSD